jgi:hypothetical protein
MTDNTTYQKFCYIFGSFAQTAPKLRSPDSDIYVVCKNMDICEVRGLVRRKYPDLGTNIKISMTPAQVQDNKIQTIQCYWQNIKPLKLYDIGNTEYTFETGEKNFACCVRDPDKQKLIHYLGSPSIDLTKRKNLSHVIARHYGVKNFMDVLSLLPRDEHHLFKKLHESGWEMTEQCSEMFRSKFIIDTINNHISGSDHTIQYSDFLSRCIKSNNESNIGS